MLYSTKYKEFWVLHGLNKISQLAFSKIFGEGAMIFQKQKTTKKIKISVNFTLLRWNIETHRKLELLYNLKKSYLVLSMSFFY